MSHSGPHQASRRRRLRRHRPQPATRHRPRTGTEDDYFVSRKLYPNVDFYSGIIYQALGLPTQMFPVMFAIPRTAGWLAQWLEGIQDPEQKIARPRQLYTGANTRTYLPARESRPLRDTCCNSAIIELNVQRRSPQPFNYHARSARTGR